MKLYNLIWIAVTICGYWQYSTTHNGPGLWDANHNALTMGALLIWVGAYLWGRSLITDKGKALPFVIVGLGMAIAAIN